MNKQRSASLCRAITISYYWWIWNDSIRLTPWFRMESNARRVLTISLLVSLSFMYWFIDLYQEGEWVTAICKSGINLHKQNQQSGKLSWDACRIIMLLLVEWFFLLDWLMIRVALRLLSWIQVAASRPHLTQYHTFPLTLQAGSHRSLNRLPLIFLRLPLVFTRIQLDQIVRVCIKFVNNTTRCSYSNKLSTKNQISLFEKR